MDYLRPNPTNMTPATRFQSTKTNLKCLLCFQPWCIWASVFDGRLGSTYHINRRSSWTDLQRTLLNWPPGTSLTNADVKSLDPETVHLARDAVWTQTVLPKPERTAAACNVLQHLTDAKLSCLCQANNTAHDWLIAFYAPSFGLNQKLNLGNLQWLKCRPIWVALAKLHFLLKNNNNK